MRKLIAVGVLVGGLLAGAGSAMAQQPQGGLGDPLTLATSGVLLPFITGGTAGVNALIEVASPVGDNSDLHMFFYDQDCYKLTPSVGLPLTKNDISFFDPTRAPLSSGTRGLVAIAGVDLSGFYLRPLANPIHTRVYLFSTADGRSRVLEPIILDTAEFGQGRDWSGPSDKTWSPLRSAATFYAPLEQGTVKTRLLLICPANSIQGSGSSSEAFPSNVTSQQAGDTSGGFPDINRNFPFSPGGNQAMRARIYDTNEGFLRDVPTNCSCLTDISVTSINEVYTHADEAPNGTYTELEVTDNNNGVFTGYRAVFSDGSALNNFFGRLSNGNKISIQGTLTNAR